MRGKDAGPPCSPAPFFHSGSWKRRGTRSPSSSRAPEVRHRPRRFPPAQTILQTQAQGSCLPVLSCSSLGLGIRTVAAQLCHLGKHALGRSWPAAAPRCFLFPDDCGVILHGSGFLLWRGCAFRCLLTQSKGSSSPGASHVPGAKDQAKQLRLAKIWGRPQRDRVEHGRIGARLSSWAHVQGESSELREKKTHVSCALPVHVQCVSGDPGAGGHV